MQGTFSYGKKEKLKSRKLIEQLFAGGRSFSQFPLKVFFMLLPEANQEVQAGVGVSARNFKKAVHRNRIKRLLREVYRLNKTVLLANDPEKLKKLGVFFLYTGKEMPDYEMLNDKMRKALEKLAEQIRS